MTGPSVTVAIPVLNEEDNIGTCLSKVMMQRYDGSISVLVVDGGSEDRTVQIARGFPGVVVLDNPDRTQAAGLNRGLAVAEGEVFVRVDARCLIASDYVASCVGALENTGAALVGGAMAPEGRGRFQAAVAAAMRCRLGVGTARFHRPDASAEWVDTVYLGACRTETIRSVGGYDQAWKTNEDAELAWRMRPHGGVWFDPSIRSVYQPRGTARALGRQFYRYGAGRARTVVCHPGSLSLRQLAAPLLLVGLLSPVRVAVAILYLAVLVAARLAVRRAPTPVGRRVPLVVLIMHLAWGLGFLTGLPAGIRLRWLSTAGR